MIDDGLAKFDALAADVDVAGAFNQRTDVAIAFAAEGTKSVTVPSGRARGRAAAAVASTGTGVFVRHAFSFVANASSCPGRDDLLLDLARLTISSMFWAGMRPESSAAARPIDRTGGRREELTS